MVQRSLLTLLGGLLVAGLLGGCVSSESPPADGRPAPPTLGFGPDTLRVGDPVTITLTDNPNPQTLQMLVREDGTLSLPLGIVVTAAGKKKSELEQEIHGQYVPRLYVRLKVTIETGDRLIFVGGQVRIPGRYPYSGEMTVLKAVKVAGDFTEFANRRKLVVTRGDGTRVAVDGKKAEEDPALDVPIYPGDKIEVRKKLW